MIEIRSDTGVRMVVLKHVACDLVSMFCDKKRLKGINITIIYVCKLSSPTKMP